MGKDKYLGAKNIKELRMALGVSQRKFAQLLDVSDTTVCYWETGKKIPTYLHARKIIALMAKNGKDINMDYIYPITK